MEKAKLLKVFVTHSWHDIKFTRRLCKDLAKFRLEVWFDDSTLRGGQRLAEEINRGLEQCDVYIPIFSHAALNSPWCWEEINAAFSLSNDPSRKGRPRIIPILAKKCELPALLRARRYIGFTGRYTRAFQETVAAITTIDRELGRATAQRERAESENHPVELKQISRAKINFDQLLSQLETARSVIDKNRLVREFARVNESPIVEDNRVTCFYVSEDAREVVLEGDWTDWQPTAPMAYLPDTPLWYRVERFPRAARLEYRLLVNGHRRLDPRNPRSAPSDFGPHSEIVMPDYRAPSELTDETRIELGNVEEHWLQSRSMHDRRTFWVCLPPNFNPRTKYPVAYFNDGDDYLHFCNLPHIASYLVHHRQVKPFISVLIKPNDREKEYARNDHYVRFLVNELVPWVDQNYPTHPEPVARAIVGASYGGLIAAHAARRHPDIFGLVGGQSGYYSYQNDALISDYTAAPNLGIRFHFVVGEFETNLHGTGKTWTNFIRGQRRFVELLQNKGYSVQSAEYPEGHQWGFWRAHIGDMLKFFWGK
jgi:enterochelin esterase-like enzyme